MTPPPEDAREPARPHRRGAALPEPRAGPRGRSGRRRAGRAPRRSKRRSPSSARPSAPSGAASCCASSPAAGRSSARRGRGAARRLLARPRTPPLSPAQAETLAIVAYLQPVSRPEITRIRGVSAESAAGTLLERGLIEESGRSQFGAVLYRTTPLFLKLFGLAALADLPDPSAWDPTPDEETSCATACCRPATYAPARARAAPRRRPGADDARPVRRDVGGRRRCGPGRRRRSLPGTRRTPSPRSARRCSRAPRRLGGQLAAGRVDVAPAREAHRRAQPCFSSMSRKTPIASRDEPSYAEPVGLYGIRLIL